MVNDVVTYMLTLDCSGRSNAEQVNYLKFGGRGSPATLAVLIALFFLTIVACLAASGRLHWIVLALYLIASLTSFLKCVRDKSAA